MNPMLAEEIKEVEVMTYGLFGENDEPQKFEITDLDSLNWALRKVHAYDSQLKEIQKVANSERQRIDSWEQRESKGINESIQFFHNLVAEYHAKVLEEDDSKKTLSTPYGKSKSITSKAQPDKANEEQLIKFAEENKLPFVKKVTTKTLQWGELKKTLKVVEKDGEQIVVDENGQAVPGAKVKPQNTTFKIEI
ncbi:host-nuclease inhibitor Gam family protein [Lysinibacillus fusiformis]|uniref:host-nuclease inhibitor Gam family protein n=1 Tax=Lysinibacillus fusiformis TaxID=28031 RepID=UPI000889ABD7|nr:host-nuclease inhibitor Gam family protein [Lysinibacillus fusiformis]SCX38358.1 Bacteriophage Mu Gam like protein [Lysinibacillus fusiformis]SDB05316.1 Bacteriophage Mu Gam like protein [Lysinibacillus fusiformis]SFH75072.1 Bacteriophage Mu Gam like protein [Lysinibacillus fusiformis]SFT29740.1 Bacteriophage Mu Gam like protein [Lysinibacillus fusiformis]